jgi:MFS family permease
MAGFGSIVIYSFGAFIKPLNAQFGWSRQTISTAFACASFTLGICSPAIGYLLDRYGPRRVILPAVILFALAFSSLSLLRDNLFQLFGTFILIGAIGNATAQLGYTRAVATWFTTHRGAAIATLLVGSSFGMVAVPVIAQQLLARVGWRWSYVVLGSLPILIAVPLVSCFVRERRESGTVHELTTVSGGLTATRSRAFWILLITLFLAAMSTTGIITQLSALLTDRGISARNAGYAVAITGASSLVGRLITGWLLDKYFAPRVGMALLFTTATGLLLLSVAHSFSAAALAAALIGFSMGGEADVTPYLLARYFGVRKLGLLYGWGWTAYAIAAALGAVLLGRAFDQHGTYAGVLVLFAAATFVAGAMMFAMPRYPEARFNG